MAALKNFSKYLLRRSFSFATSPSKILSTKLQGILGLEQKKTTWLRDKGSFEPLTVSSAPETLLGIEFGSSIISFRRLLKKFNFNLGTCSALDGVVS